MTGNHPRTTLLAPPKHLMFQQYEERLLRRQATHSALKNFRRTVTLFSQSGLDPLTAEDWEIEQWLVGLMSSPERPKRGAPPRTRGERSPDNGSAGDEKTTNLAPRTVKLHLENLSAAYNYAVHRRLIQVAPTETVKLPRPPDKEPRILHQDELRYMIGNAISDEQLLLLAILMFTGMRRNEVRCMKWEDISPASIKVIGKGGKLRHVPLHPALGEVIVRQPDPRSPYVFPGRKGAMRSETSIVYVLEQARGKVRCSFHDFRRTVATSLAENGVKERVIDKIMGWSARTVGGRYYIRVADTEMQEGMLRLYADSPVRIF